MFLRPSICSGASLLKLLAHALEEALEHLLLEHLEELLKLFPRLRVHELVVGKLFDRSGRALGEVVQPLLAAPGPFLEEPHGLLKVLRLISSMGQLLARVFQPLVYSAALGVNDILEALLQIVHHGVKIVTFQLLLALLAQALLQVA